MAKAKDVVKKKKLITPPFRAAFVNVAKARSAEEGGVPKFGVTAIWDTKSFGAKDKARWREIIAAMNEATMAEFGKKVKDLPANFHRGIRSTDEKDNVSGFNEGDKFANLTSRMRPGIVDINRDEISEDEGNLDKVYSGCYMRATVTVYTYTTKSKGVAIGLQNLQKIKDGPRLDARTNASDDFGDDADLDDSWLEDEDEDDLLDGDNELGDDDDDDDDDL